MSHVLTPSLPSCSRVSNFRLIRELPFCHSQSECARSRTPCSQRAANIYKFAIYSYYLPVALSMIMCGFPVQKESSLDPNYYDYALDILLPLGEYAQIQSEYFDSRTGNLPKTRSWCFDAVRTSGTPEQLARLEAHFGKSDATSQLHVRSVF